MTESSKQCFEAIIGRDKVGLSPSCGSIVALRDGRLMWTWSYGSANPRNPMMANFSSDGGRSWSDPQPMKLKTGEDLQSVIGPSVKRLRSGALGLVHRSEVQHGKHYFDLVTVNSFHLSQDDGQTWSPGIEMTPRLRHANRESGAVDALVQLSTGRLLLPYMKITGPTPTRDNCDEVMRFGQLLEVPRAFNLASSFAYYSDDEGKTWQRSHNEVFAMIDRGAGGIYGMGEPQVVELADGRLLMVGRTPLGQLFRTYSPDGGETWQEAEPTGLAARIGPMTLERIPDSNDVLVIWNQSSPWETMQGIYRHRISCAISSDGGVTWHHHKRLDGLDDADYIEPGPLQMELLGPICQPLDRTRYHRAPGPLRLDHPYCMFHNGCAVIVYGYGVLGLRHVIEKTYGMKFEQVAEQFGFQLNPANPNKVLGVNKVRIVPIEWLYK